MHAGVDAARACRAVVPSRPQALPFHHPDWRQLYAHDISLEQRFQAEQAAYQAEVGDGRCN